MCVTVKLQQSFVPPKDIFVTQTLNINIRTAFVHKRLLITTYSYLLGNFTYLNHRSYEGHALLCICLKQILYKLQ